MQIREQTHGHREERRGWDELREQHWRIYTTKCKTDSCWEAAEQQGELSSVLCVDLEGWDGRTGMGGSGGRG